MKKRDLQFNKQLLSEITKHKQADLMDLLIKHKTTINGLNLSLAINVVNQVAYMLTNRKLSTITDKRLGQIKEIKGIGLLKGLPSKEYATIRAKLFAQKYKQKIEQIKSGKASYKQMIEQAKNEGVVSIYGNKKTIMLRLQSVDFWARQINKTVPIAIEQINRLLGLTGGHIGKYISNKTYTQERAKAKINAQLLDKTSLTNPNTGETITLLDATVKKEQGRLARMLNWVDGMEKYAKEHEHQCAMFTITCPSSMNTNAFGRYENTTPPEAQKYLAKLWNTALTRARQVGAEPYGIRVPEAQESGTPHWHIVLFAEIEHLNVIDRILRKKALEEDEGERGASEHRYKFDVIHSEISKASSYLFKYITKDFFNSSGKMLTDKELKRNMLENLGRHRAWFKVNRIRRSQLIGASHISVWEKLRKSGNLHLRLTDKKLYRMLDACNNSDFYRYFTEQGGHSVKKSEHYIKNLNAFVGSDGESVKNDRLIPREMADTNQYNEPKRKTIGIQVNGVNIAYPKTEWVIEWNKN